MKTAGVLELQADSDAGGVINLEAVWCSCRRRVLGWPTPSNWVKGQWVEELRAEAFLVCLRALDDYDPARQVPVGAYLRMRVLGHLLSRYRQERRFAQHRSAAVAVEQLAYRPIVSLASESLERALDRLPRGDRDLLEEHLWQNQTERQIAERLGVSQQAVSKRWRTILNRLRLALSREYRESREPDHQHPSGASEVQASPDGPRSILVVKR